MLVESIYLERERVCMYVCMYYVRVKMRGGEGCRFLRRTDEDLGSLCKLGGERECVFEK